MNEIIFIVQSGLIEIQSILLSSSLRQYNKDIKITACHPIEYGDLHPITIDIFNKLNVEIFNIKNNFCPKYPIGNKIEATMYSLNHNSDLFLFLDSDILCLKKIENLNEIQAISTGRYDVITHKEWKDVFKLFNLEMPINFNHVRSPFLVFNSEFAEKWRQNAKILWESIHSKKINLRKIRQTDQISLTVTTQQFKNFKIHDWHSNSLLLSPSEMYNFNSNSKKEIIWPNFVVLQKGWLYYERQGAPKLKCSNPNSLAYYPEIRSELYSILSKFPEIDQIPSWQGIYGFYFSQVPLNENLRKQYMIGVEGNQK